jgi:hypothetical protein
MVISDLRIDHAPAELLGAKGPALRPVGAHLDVGDALGALKGVGMNRLTKYTLS